MRVPQFLGRSAVLGRYGSGSLGTLGTIPGKQAVQIVAIGSVSTEIPFIKQPLDPTTQADLVGVILEANRPAHFAVPATSQNDNPGSG